MSTKDITKLLGQVYLGDVGAESALLDRVYDELRQMAKNHLFKFNSMSTFQPTMLVHEAYLKLAGGAGAQSWENRRHFFGAASRAMRNIIVDDLRKKSSQKHGGGRSREPLHEGASWHNGVDIGQVLDINEALLKLEGEDQRSAQIVEMRFFVGLTEQEIAEILGVSDRTVRRDWLFARSWLMRALNTQEETVEGTQ